MRCASLALTLVLAGATAAEAQTVDFKSGPVLGMSFGRAAATDVSGDTYGGGWGFGLIAGYRKKAAAVELHLLERYHVHGSEEALRGDRTRGTVAVSSAGVRYSLVLGPVLFELYGGVAIASAPLLVVRPTDMGTEVVSSSMDGVGVIGGGGFAIPVRGMVVGVEARGTKLFWEQPPYDYAVPTMTNADGSVAYDRRTGDVSPDPWMVVVGLRFML